MISYQRKRQSNMKPCPPWAPENQAVRKAFVLKHRHFILIVLREALTGRTGLPTWRIPCSSICVADGRT
jgi:hypothetical protein